MPAPLLYPLRTGDPLPRSRAGFNALVQAGRGALGLPSEVTGQPGAGAADPTVSAPQNIIYVQNLTGGALPAFSVLKLGTPLISATDDPHALRLMPALEGTAPGSYLDPFAVLIEPAPDGEIVRAAVLGVAAVDVVLVGGEGWAGPESAGIVTGTGTAALAGRASGGPAKIIWRAGSTGLQRCVVLLQGDWVGDGSGGGSFAGGAGQVPVGDGSGGLTPSPVFVVQTTMNGAPATFIYQFQSSTATNPATDPLFFTAVYNDVSDNPQFFQATYPSGTGQPAGTYPTADPLFFQQGGADGSGAPNQFQEGATVGDGSPNQNVWQFQMTPTAADVTFNLQNGTYTSAAATAQAPNQFQETATVAQTGTQQTQQQVTQTAADITFTLKVTDDPATTTFAQKVDSITGSAIQAAQTIGGATQTTTFTETAGQITQAIAGGILDLSGVTVTGLPGGGGALTWTKYTLSYTAWVGFTGITGDVALFSLPSKGLIYAVRAQVTTAFSTGSTTLNVVNPSGSNEYMAGINVSAVTSPARVIGQPASGGLVPGNESIGSATTIYARLQSFGGNLNTLTAGSVDIYVLTGSLP